MTDQTRGDGPLEGALVMATDTRHLPWMTEPSDLGFNRCGWCDRVIYLPAVPCSTEPVEGLLRVATLPGQGERCKYELTTRDPQCAPHAGQEPQ